MPEPSSCDRDAGAAQHAVADDDQAAPVARLPLTDRLRRREHDRQGGGADGHDLRAAQDEQRRAERVEVALDGRAGFDRQRGAVGDVDEALQGVGRVAIPRGVRRDVAGDRPGERARARASSSLCSEPYVLLALPRVAFTR